MCKTNHIFSEEHFIFKIVLSVLLIDNMYTFGNTLSYLVFKNTLFKHDILSIIYYHNHKMFYCFKRLKYIMYQFLFLIHFFIL